MAGLTGNVVGRRYMAANSGGRHHHNIADTVEGGAIDTGTVATAATSRNSVMAELATRKGGHAGGWHQSGRNAVDVAYIAGKCDWYMRRGQAVDVFRVNAHVGRRRYIGSMASRTGHCRATVIKQ